MNKIYYSAGLIVTISFLIVEIIHFRLWSFSHDVKLARSIFLLFMLFMITYFFQVVAKGL